MHKTKLALIGAGTIGQRHLNAMSQVEEAELTAIVDNQPQVESMAVEMNVPFFHTTEEMLRVQQPEGVIVCTPTEIHLEPVLSSLNAGAHVLVEKPITSTMEEAQKIIKTSQTVSREVLVGHHRRYYGTIQETRAMIHKGAIGNLVGISGMWAACKADSYYEPSWRQLRSSGPVLINLIHEIDMLRYICGEITFLSARVTNGLRDHPKEETVAVLMEFEGGALGTFLLSDATPSPWTWEQATGENPNFPKSSQNVYRFTGSEASLEFPNLVLWKHENRNSDWHQKMYPQQIHIELEDAFVSQCAHFCAVICGSEEPRITASDATKTLEATLAVFDSSENGMEVRF